MAPILARCATLVALFLTSLVPASSMVIEERHIVQLTERAASPDPQGDNGNNLPQLLQLASIAGISFPTADPQLLLSLGPVASSLANALPTPSVLSVLITAAPSGFVSSIINDASYASSFESAFSAGSSPDWFNNLPSDAKQYLHTYTGFAGIANGVSAVQSGAVNAGSAASGAVPTATRTNTVVTATTGASAGTSGASSTTGSSGSSTSTGGSSSSSSSSASSKATSSSSASILSSGPRAIGSVALMMVVMLGMGLGLGSSLVLL